MADDMALLVADVYELALLLRRSGEGIAAMEGQTQARWQLLSVISGEAVTVPQAARRLGVTRQGVQRVANVLVDAGLAQLIGNPDHRTSPLLAPTNQGRKVLQAITERAAVVNNQLADALSPDTLVATRDGVRRLIESLQELPAEWSIEEQSCRSAR